MNRDWATSNWTRFTSTRNFNGNRPFRSVEARHLRDLMLDVRRADRRARFVVLDVHGWTNETIGHSHVGRFFNQEFGNGNRVSWGPGFLVTWAAERLNAEVSLIEFPMPRNSQDVRDSNFSGRFIGTVYSLMYDFR